MSPFIGHKFATKALYGVYPGNIFAHGIASFDGSVQVPADHSERTETLLDKIGALAGISTARRRILTWQMRIHTGCNNSNADGNLPADRRTEKRWEMTSAAQPDSLTAGEYALPTGVTWWDSDAECTLVLSQPSLDRELWRDYLSGAERSYRKHGVEAALDVPAIRNGADTIAFWATIDSTGRIVGGVRAKGPLRDADDSHATIEWAGQPGLAAVRKMIDDRAPFGILEMKSAWVTDDRDRNPALTRVLARSGFHAMSLFDFQFCMATSAPHVLDRWRSSGGVVASIPATPYPDPRYRTKMMWWNRRDFVNHAEPDQVAKILQEITAMNRQLAVSGADRTGLEHAL